ncbi:serine palmitoyltransferase 1 [Agrilus planipennis]|uniref:Serine palmitoyltransferase 1 n=1 Tax=Agrilus planipennis TaxID=224129 RepID=A0A1W4WQ02_AGRPL|nr:serine palmitoyltransferase 1 [Agrilus planipennis]XP_025833359.1 serine palmitoyltransferase 1 [Agrilus planipennis]
MVNLYSDSVKYLSLIPLTIVFIILLIVLTKKRNRKQGIPQEVIEERIRNFQPKPLIDPDNIVNDNTLERLQPNESDPDCLNLVKVNYYCFLDNLDIRRSAETCIKKYGVGSCGPRGFYGTIDIHLLLEDRLAKFMQMEEAVLYSYGFSTIASAIGAYCKKSDYIFVDENISFCAKQGLLATKGREIYFKHNDVNDLEAKMHSISQLEDKDKNQKKKIFRKFIIIEGIYGATGQICPLPEILTLCKKYKVRIFIDETYSFGVLGTTGKGVTEHFGVDRSEVDMIMGSLEGALGSIGGFCVGASVIIEHQRLSGLGYCFSASLPPFLCQASLCALDKLEQCPEYISTLKDVSVSVNNALSNLKGYTILNSDISPVKVLTLSKSFSREERISNVNKIYTYCAQKGLYLDLVDMGLRLHCHMQMPDPAIDRIKDTLSDALKII